MNLLTCSLIWIKVISHLYLFRMPSREKIVLFRRTECLRTITVQIKALNDAENKSMHILQLSKFHNKQHMCSGSHVGAILRDRLKQMWFFLFFYWFLFYWFEFLFYWFEVHGQDISVHTGSGNCPVVYDIRVPFLFYGDDIVLIMPHQSRASGSTWAVCG